MLPSSFVGAARRGRSVAAARQSSAAAATPVCLCHKIAALPPHGSSSDRNSPISTAEAGRTRTAASLSIACPHPLSWTVPDPSRPCGTAPGARIARFASPRTSSGTRQAKRSSVQHRKPHPEHCPKVHGNAPRPLPQRAGEEQAEHHPAWSGTPFGGRYGLPCARLDDGGKVLFIAARSGSGPSGQPAPGPP